MILHILKTTPAKTVRSNMPNYCWATLSSPGPSKFTFTEYSCRQFWKAFKKCSVQHIRVEAVSPLLLNMNNLLSSMHFIHVAHLKIIPLWEKKILLNTALTILPRICHSTNRNARLVRIDEAEEVSWLLFSDHPHWSTESWYLLL